MDYSISGNATMKAPPGGFNDSALTEIFQKTIAQFKLETTSTAANTPASVSNPKTTASQSAASKPSSPSPAGSIAGGIVGGIAALAIASVLLYVFYFRRKRKKRPMMAANPSELPSHNVQELHGIHRPKELDSNMLLEIDGNLYVEASAGELREPSNLFELSSSIDSTENTMERAAGVHVQSDTQ